MKSFEGLGVPPVVSAALEAMHYAAPTPVQAAAIPVLLKGSDALVEAETGSGKTAAFGVQCVLAGSERPGLRVVVLVPTRELARQVAEEIREIGTGSPFRCVAVTGGVQQEQEERTLGGDVRCIVATPGRLQALVDERRVRVDGVSLVVLDEADRMLDMGFQAEVEKLLEAMPQREQTVFVSATLPPRVFDLARRHMRELNEVRVGERAPPASLAHHRLNVFEGQKEAALIALLQKETPERAIVFFRTRQRASDHAKLLKRAGFQADALQGEMTHDQRRHVFDLFSKGVSRILVATDLAARGLDVPEMELVVNVDLPEESEAYVHRAGRAARMGRPGRVVSFVLPDEKTKRLLIEREAGVEMTPYKLEIPDEALPPEPGPELRGRQPPKRGHHEPERLQRDERAPRPSRHVPREDLPASRKERKKPREWPAEED